MKLKGGKENKFQAMPRSNTRLSNKNGKSRTKHKEKLESFVNDPLKKSSKRAKNERKEASLTVRQQSIDVLQDWQDHDMGRKSS